MSLIAILQRRRTNHLLADQLSVQQTGLTPQQAKVRAGIARARAADARILVKALTRRGMTLEDATAYAAMSDEQRRAWREANPERAR